jgi:UDP-N-acetylglucosamine:LPS N-acetylglucosamine transferase
MITHAGMNTSMECLTNGVPMVAIPVANDLRRYLNCQSMVIAINFGAFHNRDYCGDC